MSNDLDTMKPVIAGAVGNPASTCAQSCEGNAYRIEIRSLKYALEVQTTIAKEREKERDALAARLAELEGQKPVAYIDNGTGRPHWYPGALPNSFPHGTKLYARPIPAEPVNARLLEALKTAEAGLIWYQTENPEHVDECDYEALHEIAKAIAAAEAQGVSGPKRLTDGEIETAARMHGTGGWQTLTSMMTFARAIEAAVLGAQETKNGD